MRILARLPPLLLVALAACGGGDPPVRGRLEAGEKRPHLFVEGTPREQGRAQGRLLRDRIHAFHEAWHKALLAPEGDLLAPAVQARKRGLLALLGPARQHLPEPARQELAALAEASGLPDATLLLSELLTDLLRFGDVPSPLVAGQLERTQEAAALLTLEGPLARVLHGHLLWITRRSGPEAPAVTVLAWPGSLGGVIAARADGLVLLAAEEPLEAGRQGLGGVPFDLSLRLAVERATDARDALSRLSRTTAHRALALDLAKPSSWQMLAAHTGDDPVEGSSPTGRLPGLGLPEFAFGVIRLGDEVWLHESQPSTEFKGRFVGVRAP